MSGEGFRIAKSDDCGTAHSRLAFVVNIAAFAELIALLKDLRPLDKRGARPVFTSSPAFYLKQVK